MIGWVFTYILPFMLLLAILVAVHEAGHFAVAKWFKITVEKFSIGFGPRIFGKKIGETEYRLAWIPLGGYVKMAGDDPTDDAARDVPGSFLGATLYKRMLVVLAGPAVNLILPIFVLAVVFMIGREVAAPWVGGVNAGTPAAAAGLQAGDRIIEVNGKPVTQWNDMTHEIRAPSDTPVALLVERDGTRFSTEIKPTMSQQPDDFGIKRPTRTIGIVQTGPAAVVQPVSDSPAARAGVQAGDRVVSIGGKAVLYWMDLEKAVAGLPAGAIALEVERRPPLPGEPEARAKALGAPPEKKTLTLDAAAAPDSLASLGLDSADLTVSAVEPGSPAEKAGLDIGDKLLAWDGKAFSSAIDYQIWLASEPKAGSMLSVLREGEKVDLEITAVTRSEKITGTSRSEEIPWVGIDLYAQRAPAPTTLLRYRNPFVALWKGTVGTGDVIRMNVTAFSKIFSGEISVRDSVGGPIAIAHVTGSAVKAGGIEGFIEVLIHMSVILGIMNLLPIPILDGGHLAFFAIEAVIRRPPSIRVRELAQQAGLLLLLAVMAFVLVNDVVTRIF